MNDHKFIENILLFLIIISAIIIRLPMLESIDFLPMKQTISFIETKNIYLNNSKFTNDTDLFVSNAQMLQVSKRELPIVENFFGYIYRLVGYEAIYIPKLFSIFAWIFSSIYLFRILKIFFTFNSSALSLLIYLNIPFGVLISRSYLTEPYLIAFFSIAIFYIIKFKDNKNLRNFIFAIIPSTILCLLKIDYIILIAFFYLFYCFFYDGIKKSFLEFYNYLFAIVLLSSLLFYLENIFFDENLNSFIKTQFNFFLLFNLSFWLGWIAQISIVTTLPVLMLALISILSSKNEKKFNSLGYSLLLAYILKSILQTYYTSSHDYYNVSLILISSIIGGYFVNNFLNFDSLFNKIPKHIFFLLALLIFSLNSGIEIFKTNYDRKARMEKNEINNAKNIGDILNNSTKILFLSYSEGYPLMYHGNISGKGINLRNEVLENHLGQKELPNIDSLINQNELHFVPEYFVITDIHEYKRKKIIRDYFENNYKILISDLDYIIYDLSSKLEDQ